jgi:hypothetical protein
LFRYHFQVRPANHDRVEVRIALNENMTQAFVTQVIEEDGLRASAGSLDANPRSRRNPSSDDSPARRSNSSQD